MVYTRDSSFPTVTLDHLDLLDILNYSLQEFRFPLRIVPPFYVWMTLRYYSLPSTVLDTGLFLPAELCDLPTANRGIALRRAALATIHCRDHRFIHDHLPYLDSLRHFMRGHIEAELIGPVAENGDLFCIYLWRLPPRSRYLDVCVSAPQTGIV